MSNSEENSSCLVNEYYYEVGLLGPALLIILVLAFMNKRVRLKLDLLNGRPGLPMVVDFLGNERSRFLVVLAFGATASSFFAMFYETMFGRSVSGVSQQYSSSSPYAKAFKGISLTIVYGIINYPYLACLHAKYKVIGCAIGFTYVLIRCIVNLVLYMGCKTNDEILDMFKRLGMSHVLYIDMLVHLPAVICTILLCGTYAYLMYKHLKENYSRHSKCHEIFMQATDKNEPVAEDFDRIHVRLLFLNRLHRLSVPSEEIAEPWYRRLRNKIYETRPDFKFSTQFLSGLFVSFILVYQLTLVLVMMVDAYKKALQLTSAGPYEKLLIVVYDYVIAAFIIGSVVSVIQLVMFLHSHRSDVLKIYRSRKGLLQDEFIKPKTLVDNCLCFCGYQVGFTAIGYFVVSLSIFFLLMPIWMFKLVDIMYGRDALLAELKTIFLFLLPFALSPLLIWLSVVLLSMFVFRDKNYPDLTVTIDNRRVYDNVSYFYFFLNILVGLWSGLSRVAKGAALGVVFLCRLDRTSMTTGYKKWDSGFTAYIGFLNVLAAFRHPVMLCFCQILIDERRKVFEPFPPSERPRVSTRALNRWFLAAMLLRNPSLVRYRKKHNWNLNSAYSPEPTDNRYVTLEEVQVPIERLKSLDVY